jgi:hypothetical protein
VLGRARTVPLLKKACLLLENPFTVRYSEFTVEVTAFIFAKPPLQVSVDKLQVECCINYQRSSLPVEGE